MIRKCGKRIQSAFLRLYIRIAEKRYKQLRYLLQTNPLSDTLIISFSGFGNGGAAKYNYVNTLRPVSANKLFVLDNFGYQKQGSYYLGENGEWFLPEMICELINKIRTERKINQLVMVGSSKGGTAALYYAIKMEADVCIIGAPQYFIGDYLNLDRHKPILQGIMSSTDPESVEKLNHVMMECIQCAGGRKPKVYLHYSPKEHTYTEHIENMISQLYDCGFMLYEDADYDYSDHGEVAKYFPRFLLSVLEKLLKKQ